MQLLMDSYFCGINYMSSESILIVLCFTFRITNKMYSCWILEHFYYVKSKSDKTRELSELVFIPER